MRLKALVTMICAIMALGGGALAARGPRAVAVEPIYDAGVIDKGKAIEHGFVIRNEGDEPLGIREVNSSCGCTVVEYDRTIAPGRSGRVVTTIETENFRGPIAKSVTVFTDDPANPRISLVVKADVRPEYELQPVYARFAVVVGEKHPVSEHLLWSSDGEPLEVENIESPYPFLKATYREATAAERSSDGPEKQWKIVLALDAEAPVGAMADFVRLRTDRKKQKVVKLPVSGFVRPVIAVRPQAVDFGRRELDGPYSAFLEIENLSSADIDLTSVSADVAGVATVVQEVQSGKRFRLELTLDPAMVKGPFAGKVRIETSSRLQPLVEIDLSGTIL